MNRKLSFVLALVFLACYSSFYMPSCDGETVRYVGGAGPGNFTLIKSALAVSSDGDTIIICAGTYTETFTIDKSIRLLGEGKDVTKIKGFDGSSAATIVANGTHVSGIAFEYSGSYVSGLSLEGARDSVIEDCRFANTYYGLRLGGTNCKVANCEIFNCSIGISADGDIASSIRSCNISQCSNYGIFASNSTSLEISFNRFANCDAASVYVSSSNNVTCDNNTASLGDRGIHIYSSPCSKINDNAVAGSTWNVKLDSSPLSSIARNDCKGGEYGIYMYASNGSSISYSSCDACSKGDFYVDSSSCTISNCTATNSQTYGIYANRASVKVVNSTTAGNTYGIRLDRSNCSRLELCNASYNDYGAWMFASNACVVSNSTFASNDQYGAYFGNSSDCTVFRNNFVSNAIYGLDISYSSNDLFWRNNFASNGRHVFAIYSSCNWSFANVGNYWDDYSGLDDGSGGRVANDGIGDTLLPHPNSDQGSGYFALDDFPLIAPSDNPGFAMQNRAPSLTFGSAFPQFGNLTTIFKFKVNYTDADGDAPASANVVIDSYARPMSFEAGATYAYCSTLSSGDHSYYFMFDDGKGGNARYPASGTLSVSVDDFGPSIALVYPTNGSCVDIGSTVEFSISDAHMGNATYSINGTTYPLCAPYSFSVPNGLSGRFTVDVSATDLVLNEAHASFAFIVDSAIRIEVVSPLKLTIEPGTDIVLGIYNASHVNYTVNSVAYELAAPYVITTSAWADGTYDITVCASSECHSQYKNFKYIIRAAPQNSPPEIICNFTDIALESSYVLDLEGKAYDANDPANALSWTATSDDSRLTLNISLNMLTIARTSSAKFRASIELVVKDPSGASDSAIVWVNAKARGTTANTPFAHAHFVVAAMMVISLIAARRRY